MPRRKKIKEVIEITPFMDQVINGHMMGDGHITREGYLTVDHGAAQRSFVQWMLQVLISLCTPNRQISTVTRIRKGKTHKSYRFNTRNLLKEYRTKWYDADGIKIIPKEISQMFTPLFIAVWYACDGTRIQGSLGAKFDVNAFSTEERLQLQQLFLECYNIPSVINRQGVSEKTGEPYWALCINAEAYPIFHELVTRDTDLIPKLFAYKLHSINQ